MPLLARRARLFLAKQGFSSLDVLRVSPGEFLIMQKAGQHPHAAHDHGSCPRLGAVLAEDGVVNGVLK